MSYDILTPEEVVGEFFAPAATDMVAGLVAQYRGDLQRIDQVAEFAASEVCASVLHYFLDGNETEQRGRISMSAAADQLFRRAGAVASLNATYWSKALSLTDVYDAMPQARRNQWNEQIRNPEGVKKDRLEVRRDNDARPELFNTHGEYLNPADAYLLGPLPDFEEQTVRATLLDLLNSRAKFLAERVDGIFRVLSGEHVTNCPEGFGRRMIIARLINGYGSTDTDRVGYINDLRCVVAKFMGRDEPGWNATSSVVDIARRQHRGEWLTLDGGALRLRAYKCGTAHLEVHPDMAWRLNCVLAHLYPLAIPAQFRQRPKKKSKEFVMMGRPLPFAVINVLECMEQAVRLEKSTDWRRDYNHIKIPRSLEFQYGGKGVSAAHQEAIKVLDYIGGVMVPNDRGGVRFEFEYEPREVLNEIIASGCLPDQKAHQYYPTPANVAAAAIEAAQIGADHRCLEPSAGTGALADLMPNDRTTCVEISPLHCKVLTAKGHQVIEADFLTRSSSPKFDRIVMNPPFSEGRWQAHLEHAASMVAYNGRLVAILPASAKGQDVLPGWSCEWSRTYDNEFAGTNVSVVILVARSPT